MALGVYVYAGYPCLIFRPTGRRDGGNVRVRAFCKLLRLPGKGALLRLSAWSRGSTTRSSHSRASARPSTSIPTISAGVSARRVRLATGGDDGRPGAGGARPSPALLLVLPPVPGASSGRAVNSRRPRLTRAHPPAYSSTARDAILGRAGGERGGRRPGRG